GRSLGPRLGNSMGGAGKIWERHQHSYEVNPKYIEQLTNSGMIFAGKDEKGEDMQILKLGNWIIHFLIFFG
ncbi:hypothetical protein H0H93_007516, partial [Arthromyces matolae]